MLLQSMFKPGGGGERKTFFFRVLSVDIFASLFNPPISIRESFGFPFSYSYSTKLSFASPTAAGQPAVGCACGLLPD